MDDTFWWLPPSYSEEGDRIDELWNAITWIVMVTFVLVQGAIVYAMVRFRRGRSDRRAHRILGNYRLELAWTLIPTAILIYVMVASDSLWAELREQRPSDDEIAVKIWVDAERFTWNIHYAGPDKEFGTDDDFDAPNKVIVVPEGRPILIQLTSKDVLHSFFVPYLRMKVDAVPGLTTELWFSARSPGPNEKGNYRSLDTDLQFLCAELCGDLHYNMMGFLWVVPQEEYDSWAAGYAPTPEEDD